MLPCRREGDSWRDWGRLCDRTPWCCASTQCTLVRITRKACPKHKPRFGSSLEDEASYAPSLLGCQKEKPLLIQPSQKHRWCVYELWPKLECAGLNRFGSLSRKLWKMSHKQTWLYPWWCSFNWVMPPWIERRASGSRVCRGAELFELL